MGALQGIGTSTPYAASLTPWGNPGSGGTQMGYPFAQPFTPGLPATSLSGAFGAYGPQQTFQAAVQALHFVPQQLQQIQQLVQVVPHQLQQIQQLLYVLAQSYQHQHSQVLQPFQPPLAVPGWQTGQPQLFGGQPGYVM